MISMRAVDMPWRENLKACLWDLDGTLIDSYPAIAASVNHVRRHFGLEPMSQNAVRICVGHGVVQLMAKTVPGCDPQEARALYSTHHGETLKAGTVLLPGAKEILEGFKSLGIRHAVCSNKPKRFSEQLLEFLGIARFVDVLLGPEDVAAPKPAPDMLLLGLERLGTGSLESLFVGDMTVDIQAARRAGLRVAVVATGSDSEDQLRAAGPDLLASNLEKLAEILGV